MLRALPNIATQICSINLPDNYQQVQPNWDISLELCTDLDASGGHQGSLVIGYTLVCTVLPFQSVRKEE